MRLKEHINNFKKTTNTMSVISLHKLDHTIDWNNTIILDSEQSYYKRMISKMIHIKRHEMGLNKQSDTEHFPEIYLSIVGKSHATHQ